MNNNNQPPTFQQIYPLIKKNLQMEQIAAELHTTTKTIHETLLAAGFYIKQTPTRKRRLQWDGNQNP
jgi:hypothetical protein